jgi:hypothetical protein
MMQVAVVVVGVLVAAAGLLVIVSELANSTNGTASAMEMRSEVV